MVSIAYHTVHEHCNVNVIMVISCVMIIIIIIIIIIMHSCDFFLPYIFLHLLYNTASGLICVINLSTFYIIIIIINNSSVHKD